MCIRDRFKRVTVRPQEEFPEFGDYRKKLNQAAIFTPTENPYKMSILAWRPKSKLIPEKIQPKTKPVVVNNSKIFKIMLEDVSLHEEIAVDLEGHDLHSFHGMCMTVQFSTTQKDYVVHTPSCFKLIIKHLKCIFESEQVVKVFNGGQNDVLHLQRDFGIFTRGFVDLQAVQSYLDRNYDKGALILSLIH